MPSLERTVRLLIVNPNTNDATTRMLVTVAEEHLDGADATVRGVTAAIGPAMITNPDALGAAATQVVAAARSALAETPADAVIVGAIGDPGVAELRRELPIPVLGIGEAAVRTAASGGRRFGLVTTTSELAESLVALVARHAPLARFTGLRLTPTAAEVLSADPAGQLRELTAAALEARADGAEAIVVAGGPLSASARALAALSSVPIIEPVPSAVAMVLRRLDRAPGIGDAALIPGSAGL